MAEMNKEERFFILEREKIDKEVYYYLESLFNELKIEILGKYEGKLFDLMKEKKLEGWCWQTTETASLFMNDDTIIYRGDLHFDKYDLYYHSFIRFCYENNYYVFDPCLCLINSADLYFKIFDVCEKGKVSAKDIKKYFLDYTSNPHKRKTNLDPKVANHMNRFMREFFSDEYLEKYRNEIVIHGEENPSHPMYRNGSGYRDIIVENDKVKSLTVHYYMGD